MELREPPRSRSRPAPDRVARGLLVANLAAVLALGAVVLFRPGRGGAAAGDAGLAREVAGKLKAAGALDEAAALYEQYLAATELATEERARIAYSLGTT